TRRHTGRPRLPDGCRHAGNGLVPELRHYNCFMMSITSGAIVNHDTESRIEHAHPAGLAELPEWAEFARAAKAARIDPSHLAVINAAGIELDTSGQYASQEMAEAAEALLSARVFDGWRRRLLEGDIVNPTEDR